MSSPSMGSDQWDVGHRDLQVSKVENGYTVKAKFFRQRRSGQGQYDSSEYKEFVFDLHDDMARFVSDYFDGKIEGVLKAAAP